MKVSIRWIGQWLGISQVDLCEEVFGLACAQSLALCAASQISSDEILGVVFIQRADVLHKVSARVCRKAIQVLERFGAWGGRDIRIEAGAFRYIGKINVEAMHGQVPGHCFECCFNVGVDLVLPEKPLCISRELRDAKWGHVGNEDPCLVCLGKKMRMSPECRN